MIDLSSIKLTRDEVFKALVEAKVKKYFHLKNAEYWAKLEKKNDNNLTKLI